MATVKFTRHLVRYFPALGDRVQATGCTVAEIIADLDRQFPGLADYIVDDQGALRKHVNIFLGGDLVRDRQHLQDPVSETDELYIFQALSGG